MIHVLKKNMRFAFVKTKTQMICFIAQLISTMCFRHKSSAIPPLLKTFFCDYTGRFVLDLVVYSSSSTKLITNSINIYILVGLYVRSTRSNNSKRGLNIQERREKWRSLLEVNRCVCL